MDRDDLRRLVSPKMPPAVPAPQSALEQQLRAYFATPEGQSDLAHAPRVDGAQMTADGAVEALLEEAAGMKERT